ncbi:phage portal protein [Citrobacter freundii]|uniref:phage portal protein n=1 Tax=Citrobacter freundii TaxID=546 RepID=UPI002DBD3FA4|nr:phage portal protein [Citrobacter freundii]MEB6425374.1 phage portal protein [Citrobacter freundii]HCR3328861.1 phage portal protein [Citrobacter freundii]
MGFFEKALGAISPGWAASRAQNRLRLRAYEAANPTRLHKGKRESRSADTAVFAAGTSLREQARWLDENHDLVIGLFDKMEDRVIGAHGIHVEPQPLDLEGNLHSEFAGQLSALWAEWSVRPEVTGMFTRPEAKFTEVTSDSVVTTPRINTNNPLEFGLKFAATDDYYWDIHTTYPEIDFDYRFRFHSAVNRIDLLSPKSGNGLAALNVGAFGVTGMQINGIDRANGNGLINYYDPNGVLAANIGYYHGFMSVNFYNAATGAWESNPLVIQPDGRCYLGTVFDNGQRVYSPHNPQPIDLSAYATQQWVLQNFVQNIDLTAPTEFQFWDGRGYMRPTDGAAMYNFQMVGGSSNVGYIQIRYTRKLINNTWYVIN